MATKLIPESIRQVLEYRPDTGDLIWKFSQGRSKAGAIAGTPNDEGYIKIQWQGKGYLAHRIAWFLMTGNQPPIMIDHRDRNTANNKWINLRESDSTRNSLNLTKAVAGIIGVQWRSQERVWKANITLHSKYHHLYRGPDFFEACCRRKSAENRLHQPLL